MQRKKGYAARDIGVEVALVANDVMKDAAAGEGVGTDTGGAGVHPHPAGLLWYHPKLTVAFMRCAFALREFALRFVPCVAPRVAGTCAALGGGKFPFGCPALGPSSFAPTVSYRRYS